MTLRLSTLFDEQVRIIFKRTSSTPSRRRPQQNGHGSAMSNGTRRRQRRLISDDDDDEEDIDVVNGETPSTSKFRPLITHFDHFKHSN